MMHGQPSVKTYRNDQQDATVQDNLLFHCSLAAEHVSSNIIAHHQELLNCNYSFWFYSRLSLPAQHVSSVIAHHQELLNCNYNGWFYSRLSLPAQHVSSVIIAHHQELLNCNYNCWFYSRLSLPVVEQAHNKYTRRSWIRAS